MARHQAPGSHSEKGRSKKEKRTAPQPSPIFSSGPGNLASGFMRRIWDICRVPEQLIMPLVLSVIFSGCAGYSLGPTNGVAARAKSVQITPFPNETLEPRLTDAVTAQLHKQFQRDGTYQLATRDPGDIVVSGVIKLYERHA